MSDKVLSVTDSKLLEVSKDLTIAWIQKYGNNGSFYPEPTQVTDVFQTIYKSLKKPLVNCFYYLRYGCNHGGVVGLKRSF